MGQERIVEAARAVGAAGADRFAASGEWPCGIPNGADTPSLLLGRAGIGHFYLRLADPQLSSALAL